MKDTIRWTVTKLAKRLELISPLVYEKRHLLSPLYYKKLDHYEVIPRLGDPDPLEGWEKVDFDTYWGEWYSNFAFKGEFCVPTHWNPNEPAALYLPLGESKDFCHPEALVFIDGIHCGSCDRFHQEIVLPQKNIDGNSHTLDLIGWTGIGDINRGLSTRLYMRPCYLVRINQPLRNFIAAARIILGFANNMEEQDPTRWLLINTLDAAFDKLELQEPLGEEKFYTGIPEALKVLETELAQGDKPDDITIFSAGHAHIDVAWLWPLEQTRRKARHTFETVIRLMEQYPDFHFTQSQPQLYEFVRQDDPDLFTAIQKRVKQGTWELTGGMWVEADCNLTGSESLARQFLLGRSFYRRYFGESSDTPILWLPDVFGYAWSLPQLIKLAGLEYFFTIKIGWNQYNRLPYDSFWWEGLDGTRVLTHFSPTPEAGSIDSGSGASTYNAAVMPEQIIGSWTNFQQKDLAKVGRTVPLLMAFGYGDGGGGPTLEMLENMEAMRDFPAIPRVIPGKASDFFETLEKNLGPDLPTWNGELYLELHRGTYTTQSRNKRANRKSEFMLHDAEFLAALAAQTDPDYQYPGETLQTAWYLVCLNQFHDIIPGSSVNQVYVESLQQYAQVRELAERVKVGAIEAITRYSGGDHPTDPASLWLVNPTGFTRSDLAFFPGALLQNKEVLSGGQPVLVQSGAQGSWFSLPSCPPYSVLPLELGEIFQPDPKKGNVQTGLCASIDCMENNYLRVDFNAAGDIIQIFDKRVSRNVLAEPAVGNQLQAFEDRPLNWDAWDVDIFYDDHMWLCEPAASIEVIENGPLFAAIKIKRTILHSEYTQIVSLAYNSARLDFDTTIDWREKHVLLKVAFPVSILSPAATYEIQWGNVERPTHRNTSWDWARFETCAHKWVDLSEGGYGVSLLNDCKYGHDIHENVMRISLLRSPTLPDPHADEGEHRFLYSLFPHPGRWDQATIREAYAINDPLWVVEASAKSARQIRQVSQSDSGKPLVQTENGNIVIETIKQAEDGNGMIVRLYECQRVRGNICLNIGFSLKEAWKTNILEENIEPVPIDDRSISLDVRPYEIVTLRLIRLSV